MYRVFAGFVVAVFLCLSVCSSATAWPDRTVRLVLPVPAGSAADFTARLFAERLSVLWGQPVVVENRPGADGIIGVSSFINLHDDHALLFAISAVATVHGSRIRWVAKWKCQIWSACGYSRPRLIWRSKNQRC